MHSHFNKTVAFKKLVWFHNNKLKLIYWQREERLADEVNIRWDLVFVSFLLRAQFLYEDKENDLPKYKVKRSHVRISMQEKSL